jgi:energy-coupling factor transporter ATP-binding protein EcfA2
MAQGDRAVAIAGDAQAATITTGDGNVVLNVVFQADGLQIAGQSVRGQAVEMLRQLLQGSLSAIEIDWQKASRSLLNEQIQRLTTNPLTRPENVTFQTDQVYVPLGLVERKKVSRRGEDVSPEQGSLLYEETEITRKFEHGDFLEQVLQRGQSPRSGGRRIAVIGEPGAGKTTLLQQMARWVAENIEGAIAIWVSLADLQGRSVEDYLLGQWLPAVVQQQGRAEASTQVKDAFVGLFQAGRVWLLLDGVDEMPVAAGNPLGEMDRQVRLGGLLGQARLVLTCRLNLWDGDRHALDTFDVYRTLEFAYPGQVEQFVGQWFDALPEVREGQAKKLCEALGQPGKERLRDLVKNPLRLTLLCFNWYLGEGTLPETKAGLYEQFVADFYEWKRERFPTTGEQRRRLNAALGELAREAIDKEETRFRLRHDFVCEFLGDPDEPDSLFQMALRLGWLNQIGADAENRRNIVYAFFHPTFQEYFAALAIQDWKYFLNHKPENPPLGQYRVFEPAWTEIFLLWMGRTDHESLIQKNELIHNLIRFEDGSNCYYRCRAYILLAAATSEFPEFEHSYEIILNLINRRLSRLTLDETQPHLPSFVPIDNIKSTLKMTNRHQVINQLLNLLDTHQKKDISNENLMSIHSIISTILEIDPGNSKAIQTLIKLAFSEVKSEALAFMIGSDLVEISRHNSLALGALEHISKVVESSFFKNMTFRQLLEATNTSPDDLCRMAALLKENVSAQREVLVVLQKIYPDDERVADYLAELLLICRGDDFYMMDFDYFFEKENLKSHPAVESALRRLVHQDFKEEEDESIREFAALNLAELNITDSIIISILIDMRDNDYDEIKRYRSAKSLDKFGLMEKLIGDFALELFIQSKCCISVCYLANKIMETYPFPDQDVTLLVLIKLVKLMIDPKQASDSSSYIAAIERIAIGKVLPLVVQLMKMLLIKQNGKDILEERKSIETILWHCAQNMSYPNFYSAWHGMVLTDSQDTSRGGIKYCKDSAYT